MAPLEANLELVSTALNPTAVQDLDERTRTPEEILNICRTELQTGNLVSFYRDDYVWLVLDAIRQSIPCAHPYSALIYLHYFYILSKYEDLIGGSYGDIATTMAGFRYLIENDEKFQPCLAFLLECCKSTPFDYKRFVACFINSETRVNADAIQLRALLEEHGGWSEQGFLVQLAQLPGQLPLPSPLDLTRRIVDPSIFLWTLYAISRQNTVFPEQKVILWPLEEVCHVWNLFREKLENFYNSVKFSRRTRN